MTKLKADPEYRRRCLRLYLIVATTGFIVVLWGVPALEEYLQAQEPSETLRLVQIVLFLAFASLLPVADYIYRFARRIQVSGRFPPPGAKVIRDIEIREGGAAKRRAALLLGTSILLTIAAIIGMIYLPFAVGEIAS